MTKMIKCPNCDGHGFKTRIITRTKSHEGQPINYSCPVCHGQKFIPHDTLIKKIKPEENATYQLL